MKPNRRFATPRERSPQIVDGELSPSVEPAFTLDRQIARARSEMGEARWSELNEGWA